MEDSHDADHRNPPAEAEQDVVERARQEGGDFTLEELLRAHALASRK